MEKVTAEEQDKKKIVSSDQLIERLLYFAPASHGGPNEPLMQKFNVEQITNILDRNKIESIDKVYRSKEDGFNLLQFVRFFLNVIEHQEIQTLYLTVALIDFFKQISQSCGFREQLHFIDITNYICNRILDKRNEDNQIETKYIPDYRTVIPNFKIKDYLIHPPLIYSSKEELVYKLSLNKIKIDKMKHEGVVTNCYFSSTLMKVFTLDDLSDSISVYNTSCGLVKKIKPHFSKLKKDIVVLSFAYSERQERIGAVLKDFSINFWDQSDNFQFQKSISTASHCQQYQNNIWFFEYFNAWVTSDKTGHLYVWNLETERPERKIKLVFDTQINDLAVIPCINLIAVVQERKIYFEQKCGITFKKKKDGREDSDGFDIFKKDNEHENPVIYLYDFLKGEIATKIELGSQNRNPHTLQYSQNYQVLLSAGYEKKISIFEINKTFLDTSKKGELTGHQSLITSFTVVKKSPMVISADDKGKVKIWDIRNYKCVQTLDFRDKTNITKLLDMIELGKVGVLGSRINFVEFDEKTEIQKRIQTKQKLAPLWIECDYSAEELIILTKKDLRIIDMRKGVVKNIYCEFHAEDVEITFFKYFEPIQKFIIGNQKGEVKIYCLRTGRFDGKLLDHLGSITHIEYDQQNKIFITMGQDSAIQIQKQQMCTSQKQKKCNNLPAMPSGDKKQNAYRCNKPKNAFEVSSFDTKSREGISSGKINSYMEGSTKENTGNSIHNGFSTILLRQMKNNFGGREITLGAISIYHGFIVVGSSVEKTLYIWDYEFSKLLMEISLPETTSSNVEITALAFINGYSILAIGTSQGSLYFLRITKLEQVYRIKTVGVFKSPYGESITNITVDLLIKGFALHRERFMHCKVFLGHAHGHVTSIELSSQIQKLKQEPSVVHRQTFNAQRQLRENFITEIQKKKYQSYTINPQLDEPLFGEIVAKPGKPSQSEDKISAFTFEAHKGALTGLYVIELDQSYLVSIGLDEKIKIWRENFLICDWNINLPLPFKWEMEIKNEQKKKDKIMFALKIIQEIFEKYGSQISINQSKCLKVRKLLDKVKDDAAEAESNRKGFITEPPEKRMARGHSENIVLFQNEFTKKDMHYENVKKFNFNEIAGPTLREIEVQKKLDMIQKQWSMNKERVEEDKSKLLMVIRNRAQKNEEKQQILQFMQPREYNSIDKNRESQESLGGSPYVKNLMNELESIHGRKPGKKDSQGSEATPLGLNYKMTKENYTGFSLLQKSKLSSLHPKSVRWTEQTKFRPLIETIKEKAPDRAKSGCTFQKYFEERQSKLMNICEESERDMDKSCTTFRSILFRMNSKVKQSKKCKVREKSVEDFKKNERILAIATSNGKRNFAKII